MVSLTRNTRCARSVASTAILSVPLNGASPIAGTSASVGRETSAKPAASRADARGLVFTEGALRWWCSRFAVRSSCGAGKSGDVPARRSVGFGPAGLRSGRRLRSGGLLAWSGDRGHQVLAAGADQVRVLQAAVVVDLDGAVDVHVLDQQLDRRLAGLGGGDGVLQRVGREILAVDRDDGQARDQAGVEGRAVPLHVVDVAAL